MKVCNSQSTALFELASDKLGNFYRHERGDRVLTATSHGRISGQCVYSAINLGVKAEISVWFDTARGLAGRSFIQAMFTVPFVEWKCLRLTAITRASNLRAQQALLDLGFTFDAPLRAWFGNESGWCFGMLPGECRWIRQ